MQNNSHQGLINKLQRDTYLKEFRWLEKYTDPDIGFEVTVKRIDEELLAENSFFKNISGTATVQHRQSFVFLDEFGAELSVVGEEEKSSFIQRFLKSAKKGVSVRETVGEALFRLGEEVDKVHYILQTRYNRFTIYKLPKGFTLRGWMGKLLEEGRKKLESELLEANKVVFHIRD